MVGIHRARPFHHNMTPAHSLAFCCNDLVRALATLSALLWAYWSGAVWDAAMALASVLLLGYTCLPC